MFKPVKNEKMYIKIADQIKSLINEGVLKVGDRLPSERELSAQFNVSRSTVRESLTSLEILGLIEVRTGLGTFVCKPNQLDNNIIGEELESNISPTELFEARLIIEPKLSQLAAQRATIEDVEEMAKVIEQAKHLEQNEIDKFEELDRKFHLLIAKAANNEVLYRFEENINSERLGKLWGNMKVKSLQKEGRMGRYKVEHQEIFDSIRERNPALAEKLTRKHLLDIKKNIFGE
ncbi:MAG: FadR/GntR family transcriptional regulator [Bacillota bacterium]